MDNIGLELSASRPSEELGRTVKQTNVYHRTQEANNVHCFAKPKTLGFERTVQSTGQKSGRLHGPCGGYVFWSFMGWDRLDDVHVANGKWAIGSGNIHCQNIISLSTAVPYKLETL